MATRRKKRKQMNESSLPPARRIKTTPVTPGQTAATMDNAKAIRDVLAPIQVSNDPSDRTLQESLQQVKVGDKAFETVDSTWEPSGHGSSTDGHHEDQVRNIVKS